jgi:tRNA (adenine57-N1/adenine58-N1)-methyltransferase
LKGQHFEYGENIVLIDSNGRQLLITLTPGEVSNTHQGQVRHDELVGLAVASRYATSSGKAFFVARPSLEQIVLNMTRGAQIIYPKDAAQILLELSALPGWRILESGVGSGSMTMALLRSGLQVTGVERREDFLNLARKNLARFLPKVLFDNFVPVKSDLSDFMTDDPFDGAVIDMVEPWSCLTNLGKQLVCGARAVFYVTNVGQVDSLVKELRKQGWEDLRIKELMQRIWTARDRVLRPEQRMVGHTGFLISAIATPKAVGSL